MTNQKTAKRNIIHMQAGNKPSAAWDEIHRLNKVYLIRFFSNVRFILRGAGVSNVQLKKDMFTRYGFIVSLHCITRYINNPVYSSVAMNYLQFFCLYLHEPLDRMLSVDYSTLSDYTPSIRGVGTIGG